MSERETMENHVHLCDKYSPDYCVWTEVDGTTCGVAIHDEPAPSPDDPHGACSRALVGMAVERDKARLASAASERAYRETRAIADDNLRRLLDCREVVRSLAAERDASRTAHAALVAELREAEVEWHDAWSSVALDDNEAPVLRQVALAWLSARAVLRALLDRHAPTTGATP